MKTNYILHVFALLLFVFTASAQQGINYKAIIHDENGEPLANTFITIQFTILENGTTAVYKETHIRAPDANGIVVANIGEGLLVKGDFDTIDWGSNPHFLKTEIDIGEGFTDMGTTEFKTVPYALHAGNGFSGSWLDVTDKPTSLSEFGISDGARSSGIIAGLVNSDGIVLSGEGFNLEIIDGDVHGYDNGNFFRIHFIEPFKNFPVAVVSGANFGQRWSSLKPEEYINVYPTKEYVDIVVADHLTSTSVELNLIDISFVIIGDVHPQDAPTETVIDIDNNTYSAMQIGSQIWMTENLKTTKYNDGTPITQITDPNNLPNLENGAYCWFILDSSQFTVDRFGAYYTWEAVNRVDLCPSGWHVPTDDEWKELEIFLGMSGDEVDLFTWDRNGQNLNDRGVEAEVGNKLKDTSFWEFPNTGTNESGFTGRPGGFAAEGYFDSDRISSEGQWWTSTALDDGLYAIIRRLTSTYQGIVRIEYAKQYGYNVRCVKD